MAQELAVPESGMKKRAKFTGSRGGEDGRIVQRDGVVAFAFVRVPERVQ
jgi:hypothetical protein